MKTKDIKLWSHVLVMGRSTELLISLLMAVGLQNTKSRIFPSSCVGEDITWERQLSIQNSKKFCLAGEQFKAVNVFQST
jgi:hypothetical protein